MSNTPRTDKLKNAYSDMPYMDEAKALTTLCHELELEKAQMQTERRQVTDEMVNRFLLWRLPASFSPDCGVKFTPFGSPESHWWPIGTNILNADQARQMLEHVICMPNDLDQTRPATNKKHEYHP